MKIQHLRGLGLIALGLAAVSATAASDVYSDELGDSDDTDANCEVSAWTFSKCENGHQVRTRNVVRELRGRGMPCPPLEQLIPCQPVACDVSEWTEFSACEYGFKERTREVLVEPQYGGAECPRLLQRVRCSIGECEVCDWDDWICDPYTGKQSRYRHVIAEPKDRSSPCPHLVEEKLCDPVNCVLSDKHVPVTICDPLTGTQRFELEVIQQPLYDGVACVQPVDIRPCAVDCTLSSSDAWTTCDKTTGLQSRSRTILFPALNGGEECPTSLEETQKCPVDCEMGSFGEWSACDSKSGKRARSRVPVVNPLNGGDECPSFDEEEDCAVDCVVDYSEWSSCDEYAESQFRSGKILVHAKNGGEECPPESVLEHEERRCEERVDCVCKWSKWGACKADGHQYRKRVVSKNPKYGGKECPPANRRKQRRPCRELSGK